MLLSEILVEMELGQQYKTIHDAVIHQKILAKGKIEIWYVQPSKGRDFRMGVEWIVEKGILPKSTKDLKKTHKLLGKIKGAGNNANALEIVWGAMQGEHWSPAGEANTLIKKLGLHHTSMSMGDVIVMGKDMYMVDTFGFENISKAGV